MFGKIQRIGQPAGNQQVSYSVNTLVGSSETVRLATLNLDCFTLFIQHKPEQITNYPIDFLTWFIGFSEGDGSFIVTSRGEIMFVITQHSEDSQVLFNIKKQLGFGNVYKQNNNCHRYIVQDKVNLIRLIHLFNGNLMFIKKQKQFEKFVIGFNTYYNMNIIILSCKLKPSLNDAWLSGLIDAEGCFNVSVLLDKKIVRIRFIVSQLYEDAILLYIKTLFNCGRLEFNKSNNCTSYVISRIDSLFIINGYLLKYPLHTRKKISYLRWNRILDRLYKKMHKTDKGLQDIHRLSKLINNFTTELTEHEHD
jgi:hypothetical protein